MGDESGKRDKTFPSGWTQSMLDRMVADRENDVARLQGGPRMAGGPNPVEANLKYIARRERLIQRIQEKQHGNSMRIRRDFNRSR